MSGFASNSPRRLLIVCVLAIGVPAVAHAQAPAGGDEPHISPLFENVTRVERWSFFTPTGNGDPDYTLITNRATFGVEVDTSRLTVRGAFRYTQLLGIPGIAGTSAPLGPGGWYFAAARSTKAFQLYFRSMSLRVKRVLPGLSVEGGRLPLLSGEGTAFAGRLIGSGEGTAFERAFDGVRLDYAHRRWRAHASFVMPTQGAFEESANPTMTRVRVASAAWASDALQVFAHSYRDTRAVTARPDNSALAAPRADIDVYTLGALWAARLWTIDLDTWGALQRGRWYGEAHRAGSGSAEARRTWSAAAVPVSIGGGWLYASGDDDGRDRSHGTFFPMLPSVPPGVLAATFAQMNLRDLHGSVRVRPRRSLELTGAVHRLSLATASDRWYSGTGATAARGPSFGYSTRGSFGARPLATAVLGSGQVTLDPRWTITIEAAVVHSDAVVARQFAGRWLGVASVQSRVRIP